MMPYTVKAEYRNQIIPEYQGNPLIEALPDIWSTEHVIGMLSDKAAYNNGERKLDIQYRLHCIHRLFRYFPISISTDGFISMLLCTFEKPFTNNTK